MVEIKCSRSGSLLGMEFDKKEAIHYAIRAGWIVEDCVNFPYILVDPYGSEEAYKATYDPTCPFHR